MVTRDLCGICQHMRQLKPRPATHGGSDLHGRKWSACWDHHQVLAAWMWLELFEPENVIALAAASEALAPIRDLHKRHRDLEWDGEWSAPYCQTCAHERWGDLGYQPWPCDTARLVYTTEELNRD